MEISAVVLTIVLAVLPVLHRIAIREQSGQEHIAAGQGSVRALGGQTAASGDPRRHLEDGFLVRMPEDLTFLPAQPDREHLWIPIPVAADQVADARATEANDLTWTYRDEMTGRRYTIAVDDSALEVMDVLVAEQTPHFDFEANAVRNTRRTQATVLWFALGVAAFVLGALSIATTAGKLSLGLGVVWMVVGPLLFRDRIPDPQPGPELWPTESPHEAPAHQPGPDSDQTQDEERLRSAEPDRPQTGADAEPAPGDPVSDDAVSLDALPPDAVSHEASPDDQDAVLDDQDAVLDDQDAVPDPGAPVGADPLDDDTAAETYSPGPRDVGPDAASS